MNKLLIGFFLVGLVFVFGCTTQVETTDIMEDESDMKEVVVGEPMAAEMETPAADEGTGEITFDELAEHGTLDDCWIVYEGKVYDYSNAPRHPSMDKTFYRHCGNPSGFESGAKSKHSKSSQSRVENYGSYVGELEK